MGPMEGIWMCMLIWMMRIGGKRGKALLLLLGLSRNGGVCPRSRWMFKGWKIVAMKEMDDWRRRMGGRTLRTNNPFPFRRWENIILIERISFAEIELVGTASICPDTVERELGL
jgi:hypothetical protein